MPSFYTLTGQQLKINLLKWINGVFFFCSGDKVEKHTFTYTVLAHNIVLQLHCQTNKYKDKSKKRETVTSWMKSLMKETKKYIFFLSFFSIY